MKPGIHLQGQTHAPETGEPHPSGHPLLSFTIGKSCPRLAPVYHPVSRATIGLGIGGRGILGPWNAPNRDRPGQIRRSVHLLDCWRLAATGRGPGNRKAGLLAAAMTDLDNPKTYEQLDPSGLRGRLRDLPDQCQAAWHQSQALKLPDDWKHISYVVIGGMGGSAIAGDLAKDLAASQQAVPITVIRDFQLPFPLTRNHLFVACSFSGNTDETLSLLQQARQSEAQLLAVAGGGQLARMAEEEGLPLLSIQTSGEPRSALGYNLLLLLGVLARLGLVSTTADDVQAAFVALREQVARLGEEIPARDNPAKQLAQELVGRLALIYAGGIFTGVARRWKTQLNENAKAWAFYESIPELLHNSVEAFHTVAAEGSGVEGSDRLALLLLPAAASMELGCRYQIVEELLTRQGIPHRRISGSAGPPLAQQLTMVLLGDYVSYYLALIRSIDPSGTPLLDLGKQLASQASTPRLP